MTTRRLQRRIPAVEVSEGAGVRVRRSLGQRRGLYHDPFLMLDTFGSEKAEDYIGGFPPHPHRGFETVTYMLHGHLRHEDHLGNRGELRDGGVQWMTAARGIVHSEMPQQTEGLMQGFQLWINLPAAEKMKPAAYRDIEPEEIPHVALPGGGEAVLIAGTLHIAGRDHHGPVSTPESQLSTDPLLAELRLTAGERFEQTLPTDYNAFIYPFDGDVAIGEERTPLEQHCAGLLGPGDDLQIAAGDDGARLMLLAGKPIGEPVAQYGPFVMNTAEEIEQTLQDYRDGALTDK